MFDLWGISSLASAGSGSRPKAKQSEDDEATEKPVKRRKNQKAAGHTLPVPETETGSTAGQNEAGFSSAWMFGGKLPSGKRHKGSEHSKDAGLSLFGAYLLGK